MNDNETINRADLISRRKLITVATATAGVVLTRTADGRVVQTTAQNVQATPEDPTKVPGAASSAIGGRSPFERPERILTSERGARTPLQDLYGMITPSGLHFERHHGGVPQIDPDRHHLLIHGMVDRPLKLSLHELKRFPAVSRICFLECAGNLYWYGREENTPGDICGMTSQSEWTGVLLSTLFREVGVKPKATWFLAEGSDAAVMTRSVPMSKGWDDAMIAYAQNGEAMRPEQGYPMRLLLPGWEGNASVKWLRRIEVADAPFMTREETARYTEVYTDGTAHMFSFVMDARSIITFPAYPNRLQPGWVEIRGLAWSGRDKIRRVDISTDSGRSWTPAELQSPVLSKAHTRFRHLWRWNGAETQILSRAVDETGYVQPTGSELVKVRVRPDASYHLNPITAWKVRANGEVVFRVEDLWQGIG